MIKLNPIKNAHEMKTKIKNCVYLLICCPAMLQFADRCAVGGYSHDSWRWRCAHGTVCLKHNRKPSSSIIH